MNHGSLPLRSKHESWSAKAWRSTDSAARLDARAELLPPLALVGLAPLELARLQGLAADNDLEALVLVRGARDALEVALCHHAAAPEALAVRGGLARAESEEQEHCDSPHLQDWGGGRTKFTRGSG